MAETEVPDELAIAIEVAFLKIAKQATPFGNHFQEATPTVMVLFVGAEVVGKVVDACRKQRNLNGGRSGIPVMILELRNSCVLVKTHLMCILTERSSAP